MSSCPRNYRTENVLEVSGPPVRLTDGLVEVPVCHGRLRLKAKAAAGQEDLRMNCAVVRPEAVRLLTTGQAADTAAGAVRGSPDPAQGLRDLRLAPVELPNLVLLPIGLRQGPAQTLPENKGRRVAQTSYKPFMKRCWL